MVALPVAAAARADAHSHSGSHAQPSFADINWWGWDGEKLPVGWFFVDFAVFAGIVAAAVAKPLRRGLFDRHVAIKKAIADAAATHARASQAHQQARQRLTALDAEVRALEEASLRDGEAERAQMVAHARAYAERLQAEQLAQQDEGIRRLQERLRRRLLAGVLLEAQQEIATRVTPSDHARLIDEAIDKLAVAQPELRQLG